LLNFLQKILAPFSKKTKRKIFKNGNKNVHRFAKAKSAQLKQEQAWKFPRFLSCLWAWQGGWRLCWHKNGRNFYCKTFYEIFWQEKAVQVHVYAANVGAKMSE
jgi:hypothetical protein